MSASDLRPSLAVKAQQTLAHIASPELADLLIKNWMSHDARWFMAVAGEFGLSAANRLNKIAAHDVGRVEAQRIVRALHLPPITIIDEYLSTQEIFIALLGPGLIDYQVSKVDDTTIAMQVLRCFAYDNAVRAKIADEYECGIFARVTGWFDALRLRYDIQPNLGKCLRAQGQECVYSITLNIT